MTPKGTYRLQTMRERATVWQKEDPSEQELREALDKFDSESDPVWLQYSEYSYDA